MLLESLPQTFVGLRNGVSLALVIIVVAEMFIGSQDGLGHSVFEASNCSRVAAHVRGDLRRRARSASAGPNLLFLLIERRFVHWSITTTTHRLACLTPEHIARAGAPQAPHFARRAGRRDEPAAIPVA